MGSMGRGTIRRMVEGKSAAIEDCGEGVIKVVHHFGGSKPQRPKTIGSEPGVAFAIATRPIARVMGSPIDFDGTLCPWATEVEHIPADWMLPAKPPSGGSRS